MAGHLVRRPSAHPPSVRTKTDTDHLAQEEVRTPMDMRPLDERLSTSPQISPEDMPAIVAAGYRSVISNRPDGEVEGQPLTADIKAAAEKAGLAFAHVPVVGGQISDDDIALFRSTIDQLPAPVFGFCRTGTRTTFLWALAHAKDQNATTLIETAAKAGYDLNGLRARLETGAA
ncbi:protein tyrosine phosphatase family protein [Brevundimonas terrae]|uniref:Protein tyrosine phosphatase family protein n=2 Tax=Brevundimonas terrae TaxID=363631 RepID=A0ABN0XZ34_9CAUL